MLSVFENEACQFDVVVNDEGQYSIWPIDWQMPLGWSSVGMNGLRADCLKFIDAAWIEMRPKTLQKLILADEITTLT